MIQLCFRRKGETIDNAETHECGLFQYNFIHKVLNLQNFELN